MLAGKTYTIDRRTTRRFFLLRPDAEMTALFWYVLAVVSARHGIEVHCVQLLSTHYHMVVTDRRETLPEFLQEFHLALAMTTKRLRDWDEEVWNKSQTGRTEHVTVAATIKQCAYVIANCVAAGIVDRPRRYCGPKTLAAEIGVTVTRWPRPKNSWLVDQELWPEWAELRIAMPQSLEDAYGAVGARAEIEDAVAAAVRVARAERREKGLGFCGAKAAARAPITTQSTKDEIGGRRPTFATGPGDREAFLAKVADKRAWDAWYADSFARWSAGDRDVEFPPGTWKMRVVHGARVAPPPQ